MRPNESRSVRRHLGRFLVACFAFAAAAATQAAVLVPIAGSRASFESSPTTTTVSAPPLVMLAMSKDEQLYVKAYTDYTDLDNDGVVDTTYNNNFDYAGYFDSDLCYSYLTTSPARFKAASNASATHKCSNAWSGNFLNWVTMSRLDVIRTVLYGGLRQTDSTTQTILERAFIPNDVHAWAKVYSGSDIADYTPYSYSSSNPVSFCNVSYVAGASGTTPSTESATSDMLPMLRVARGNFSEWATTEVRQCLWKNDTNPAPSQSADNPNTNTITPYEMTVRVEVCASGTGAIRESFCREYVNGTTSTFKPAGLLQRYGESGQLRFGLITGSYAKPRAGGLLRRNVGKIAGNNGTGCSTGDEIKLTDGTFCNQTSGTEGIINTLNHLRIYQWDASAGKHDDCGNYGIANRHDQGQGTLKDPGNGSYVCNSWGNPLSEIYDEALRYFSTPSGGPTSTFAGTDPATKRWAGDTAGNFPSPSWTDPLTVDTRCANCAIVLLSTGLNSFDTDQLPAIARIGDINAATKIVGDNEGVSGSTIIGRNTATPSGNYSLDTHTDYCSAKNLADLSLARGICPEVPSFEGGYQIAGLAYKAHTTDLRTDLQDKQTVTTYAIALAEQLPSFSIPTPNGSVTIVPGCQANNDGGADITDGGWRSCALANVSVGPRKPATSNTSAPSSRVYGRPLVTPSSTVPAAGSFFIGWEDSPWGNDRDLDMTTMITYCVGAACTYNADGDGKPDICFRSDSSVCRSDGSLASTVGANEVLVRTEVLSAVAGNALLAGFTLSGAASSSPTTDGFQRVYLRPGNSNNSLLTSTDTIPSSWSKPKVVKITAGTSAARQLPNPLLYAAKYGGFQDSDGDGLPTTGKSQEWDTLDNFDGTDGSDGIPDNFFPVRNPTQLANRLAQVFNDILQKTSSGTAAAVVANTEAGEGAVYQALFEPSTTVDDKEVRWIGTLQALWVDDDGNLRQDSNANGVLDTTDVIVKFRYDSVDKVTKFDEYASGGTIPTNTGLPLSRLKPIWNARDRLSSLSGSLSAQRGYTTTAANGRYILTWVDKNQNGVVDSGETGNFTASTQSGSAFSTTDYGILNAISLSDANKIVEFVRGTDQTGLRARLLNYDRSTDGSLETMRLGDIVQSTPTVVAAPAEGYDLLYADQSYGAFRRKYMGRRTMVYVGANDGLLHAFNGGFFDPQSKAIRTSPISGTGTTGTAHPLGSEIWAYAPYNLLPHLTWLTDPSYNHVWYMDGQPRVFDARIFTPDATHPGGWGTVLVAGMRFGGSPLTLSAPATSVMTTANYKTAFQDFGGNIAGFVPPTSRSAYVVMDVTDPEQPPVLLTEITDAALKFTTSFPTVVPEVAPNAPVSASLPSGDNWYLAFGSGPADLLGSAPSSGSPTLYVYDLKKLATKTALASSSATGYPKVVTAAGASFLGDPVTVDWDLDFKADSLYFGSVGGTFSAPTGKLLKVDFHEPANTAPTLAQVAPSVWIAPQVVVDVGDAVMATPSVTLDENGTRWVIGGTGRFYSLSDKPTTSDHWIFGVIDKSASGTSPPYTFGSFVDVSSDHVLTNGTVVGVTGAATETALIGKIATVGGWKRKLTLAPGERSVSEFAILSDIVFATAVTPSADLCGGVGSSRLLGMYYKTGSPKASRPTFGTADYVLGSDTYHEGILSQDLYAGLASTPSLLVNRSGLSVITQSSNNVINVENANVGDDVRSGEIDWRERF